MKFLVALVAAAAADSFTVCQFTQTYHLAADTDCSDYGTGTEVLKVLVNQCTFSNVLSAWFKVTSCTTIAVEQEWHNTDGSCGTASASLNAANKVSFTGVGVCVGMTKTGSVVDQYTKIASLAGDTDATLCGATWKFYQDSTLSGASLAQTYCASGTAITAVGATLGDGWTAAEAGLGPNTGTAWIKNQCYKFGQKSSSPTQTDWYWKITGCALTSGTAAQDYTVALYKDATNRGTCTTAVPMGSATFQGNNYCYIDMNVGTGTATGAAAADGFVQDTIRQTATELAMEISGVINTHTVAQPVAPTTATAAATTTTTAAATTTTTTTTDGAKTLVTGAIAAISMMYL